MEMFKIQNNDLLSELKSNKLGCSINNIPVNSPSYADDIALVALHKPILQRMLNIAYRFSQRWRFEFNATKSELLIFGTDMCPNLALTFGTEHVQKVTVTKHMGLVLASDDHAKPI